MWKLVSRNKLSNRKSNCVIPLLKTLQWPPIAIRTKSKVLLWLARPSNSDLISFLSCPPCLPLFQNFAAKVAFFRFCLLCQTVTLKRGLYNQCSFVWILLFQIFPLHDNSDITVLLTRPMSSTTPSTCVQW